MTFSVYPDAATAQALGKPINTPVRLAINEAMAAFVPLKPLVGADPTVQNKPTTFIRIAMSGAAVTPDGHPTIELLAHEPDGSPGQPISPATATSLQEAVFLFDGVNIAAAARAYFIPPYTNNVYCLKALIEIADTKFWIKITNTSGSARDFVWVVADNDDDTRQPWLHVTPFKMDFDAIVGRDQVKDIALVNLGTGPVVVGKPTPALSAVYEIPTLPMTLQPNAMPPVRTQVNFKTPSAPNVAAATTHVFATTNKPDRGPFGNGHNNKLTLSSRTQFAVPSFAALANQFSPKRGGPASEEVIYHGCEVRLFGSNFNDGLQSVHFGSVLAERFVAVSANEIRTNVPAMDPGLVRIKVTTRGGSVTSDADFQVAPLPVLREMDPAGWETNHTAGRGIRILGEHLSFPNAARFPAIHCTLTERSDGIHQPESISFDLIVLGPIDPEGTVIPTFQPKIDGLERFSFGKVWIERAEDFAPTDAFEWEIKGL